MISWALVARPMRVHNNEGVVIKSCTPTSLSSAQKSIFLQSSSTEAAANLMMACRAVSPGEDAGNSALTSNP